MPPRTDCSASRFCGGRRSKLVFAAFTLTYLHSPTLPIRAFRASRRPAFTRAHAYVPAFTRAHDYVSTSARAHAYFSFLCGLVRPFRAGTRRRNTSHRTTLCVALGKNRGYLFFLDEHHVSAVPLRPLVKNPAKRKLTATKECGNTPHLLCTTCGYRIKDRQYYPHFSTSLSTPVQNSEKMASCRPQFYPQLWILSTGLHHVIPLTSAFPQVRFPQFGAEIL
ncbi:Uncharacterised protein [Actinobaculum suis]|uniref:Uncharacterized protein n=1 Tax=Actinobaculum suis TaxID=1657 RepID=A0A7Z8Y7W1_9ACTO|nr:Uncharacterised protein [Actinobaculum suis]